MNESAFENRLGAGLV